MIEIKPTRRKYHGYKLNEVYLNEQAISKGSDVIELRIKDVHVKLDITENGYIRIWSDDGKFINDGYIGSLSCDFKLKEAENDNSKSSTWIL